MYSLLVRLTARAYCVPSTAVCLTFARLPSPPYSQLEAAAGFEAMGFELHLGVEQDFPGMRRFYNHDPQGNRLEFLEPIGVTSA